MEFIGWMELIVFMVSIGFMGFRGFIRFIWFVGFGGFIRFFRLTGFEASRSRLWFWALEFLLLTSAFLAEKCQIQMGHAPRRDYH